jgi:hypothetical protein
MAPLTLIRQNLRTDSSERRRVGAETVGNLNLELLAGPDQTDITLRDCGVVLEAESYCPGL